MPNSVVGVMSGTSMDGVDAVWLSFDAAGHWSFQAHAALPYPEELRHALLALPAHSHSLLQAEVLGVSLAQLYAKVVQRRPDLTVDAIACHGQTILHRPDLGFSCQIGHMPTLAARTGFPVIFDFRNHDVALGGQGAPLTPLFHRVLLDGTPGAVLNLGGFCNMTSIQPDGAIYAGDLGPCNVLLDAWVYTHRLQSYDAEGAWAATGRVIPELLAILMAHPFCQQPFPKSTGRDQFSLAWLQEQLRGRCDRPEDVQRTLVAWIVALVVAVYTQYGFQRLYLCGGGAYNTFLCEQLVMALPHCVVDTSTVLGLAPQHVEGAAFAWLGYQYLQSIAMDCRSMTGASRPHIMGCYCPV